LWLIDFMASSHSSAVGIGCWQVKLSFLGAMVKSYKLPEFIPQLLHRFFLKSL